MIRPIRGKRHRLVRPDELEKAINLAALRLSERGSGGEPELILVLLDADQDPACILGPALLAAATELEKRARPAST